MSRRQSLATQPYWQPCSRQPIILDNGNELKSRIATQELPHEYFPQFFVSGQPECTFPTSRVNGLSTGSPVSVEQWHSKWPIFQDSDSFLNVWRADPPKWGHKWDNDQHHEQTRPATDFFRGASKSAILRRWPGEHSHRSKWSN